MFKILFTALMFTFFISNANAVENKTQISPEKTRSMVSFCNTCHGSEGNGPGTSIPYLTGQSKDYMITTMTEFKNGKRRATVMKRIAQGYNDEEIVAVSDWFAKMKWVNNKAQQNAKTVADGKKLSKSCVACHNSKPDVGTPIINGQPSDYLYEALLEYKNKERNPEGSGASMTAEVMEMKASDLRALAEYFSSIK